MVQRNVFMRNFPVLSMKLSEGTLTRSNAIGPNGGRIDGMVVYSAPLVKGDMVIMDAACTDKGVLMAVKATVSAVGLVHGVLVSSPFGVDAVTVSGQTPATAQKRVADVALFGLGVISVVIATGETMVPGDSIGPDSAVANTFAVKESAASATLASNGGLMALGYGVATESVPALINATFAVAE
jgi:hypothetical protein